MGRGSTQLPRNGPFSSNSRFLRRPTLDHSSKLDSGTVRRDCSTFLALHARTSPRCENCNSNEFFVSSTTRKSAILSVYLPPICRLSGGVRVVGFAGMLGIGKYNSTCSRTSQRRLSKVSLEMSSPFEYKLLLTRSCFLDFYEKNSLISSSSTPTQSTTIDQNLLRMEPDGKGGRFRITTDRKKVPSLTL